ncbi:MAG: DUF1254 domain-containing protein [Thermodesulfobacteriota bacterium]
MKKWLKWILLTLLLAATVHLAAVWAYPYVILAVVSRKAGQRTGLGLNQAYHAEPTTPDQRTVVMPSPDLIYSLIRYDVSQTPILITAAVPAETYWSLSFYASNTDNFFTLNDRQTKTNPVRILLVGPDTPRPSGGQETVVVSPSSKGVVLARILIKDEAQIGQLVEIQKKMTCRSVK